MHIFIARRVNHDQRHVSQPPLMLFAVTRHARLVMYKRDLFTDKAVKQRGLAHIWASDNSKF